MCLPMPKCSQLRGAAGEKMDVKDIKDASKQQDG